MAVGEDKAVGRKHEPGAGAAARRFALRRARGLSDLDVNDRGADPLGRRDHRSGIGVEQDGVAFAARHGGRPRRTFIENLNRAHGPEPTGAPTRATRGTASASQETMLRAGPPPPPRTPAGGSLGDWRRAMKRPAIPAPRATPTAVTPWSTAPLSSGSPRWTAAHCSTRNCRVAPAPQKSVVTEREICPSLSFQSMVKQT